MRALGYLLLIIIFSLVAWWVMPKQSWLNHWQNVVVSVDQTEYDNYKVYWLDEHLEFKLPANTEQVRVMLTPSSEALDSRFSIDFSALGFDEQVIDQGRRLHRQKAVPQALQQLRFFEAKTLLGAGFTSEFYIDGSGANPLATLRLSLADSNHQRVAVRVAVLERKKDAEVPVLWQRMHRDKRLKLLQGNIYPPDLVSETHRLTALKYQWLPIGPEGENYQSSTLFIKRSIEAELLPLEQIMAKDSSALYVDESKVYTLVQDPAAMVDSIKCAEPVAWIELAWLTEQGITTEVYQQNSLVLPELLDVVRIRTSGPCQLTLHNASKEVVEKPNNLLRSYLLTNDNSLVYPLKAGRRLQPLKIAARGLNLLTENQQISWQLLSEQGLIIDSGKLTLPDDTDWFERVSSQDPDVLHSKIETYIVAQANAAKLVFLSEGPTALLSVFNRPVSLPYDQQFAKWFSILPQNNRQLKAGGLSKLIYWQQRLQSKTRSDEGLKQWSSIASESQEPLYEVFSVNQSPVESVSGYRRLTNTQVNLLTEDGSRSFTPDLVYLRQTDEPIPANITFGEQSLDFWLSAKAGRVTLPHTAPGKAIVDIADDGKVDWYINHLDGESEFRVRRVYALEKPLYFTVEKSTEVEWVTLHYFSASAKAHMVEVSLDAVVQPGKKTAFTIPRRRYRVPEQMQQGQSYLLNQPNPELWGPLVLKFPLAGDLADGAYRLMVSSQLKTAGYVQVSYVKDDVDVILKHFTEVTVED